MCVHAQRIHHVEIERPDLKVFDPVLPQRHRRSVRVFRRGFRADRAVVLRFDLQGIGIELPILTVGEHTDGFVAGIGRGDGRHHARQVVVQRVH